MDIKSNTELGQRGYNDGDIVSGILFPGYGYERVSYALPTAGVSFKRVYSLPIHRFLKGSNFYRNTPIVLPSKVDLIHTWNAIPITTKPFVITFELEMPRYFGNISSWQRRLGYFLLRSKRCKGIYALSQTAAEQAKQEMLSLGEKNIADKISYFRGGVALPKDSKLEAKMENVGEFSQNRPLKVIFIGGDAFRKGFVPTYNALSQLVENGLSIEMTFIGQFLESSYTLKEFSPSAKEWQKKVGETPWIKQSKALPNSEVMSLLAKSDILLFPSFDESLGWVIIEAAMLGIPSVTTNIFAFPELVKHQKTGYVIPINLGKQRRWEGVWLTGEPLRKEIEIANEAIKNGIMDVINSVYESPHLLSKWSSAGATMHTEQYDQYTAAKILTTLYQQAI